MKGWSPWDWVHGMGVRWWDMLGGWWVWPEEPLDNARVRSGYLAQSRDSISKPDRPSERLESGFECLPFQVNGAVEIVLVMVG